MVQAVKANSLLILLLLYFVHSFGQKHKAIVLNLSINKQPIHELFAQIEQQSHLNFSFNTELINRDSIVSYQANKQTIEKVISQVFSDRIEAKVIGNHIVLIENRRKEKKKIKTIPQHQNITYTAYIINARNKLPVINASIYDISSRESILSDSLGRFEITCTDNRILRNYNIAKGSFNDTIISINFKTTGSQIIKLFPIEDDILPMKTKEVKYINSQEKSDFLLGMVPQEGLQTSLNLNNIYEKRFAQVSFIPIVGTNMTSSGIIENNVSLNILGGYNGAVKGIEIGGLINIIDKNIVGLQVGGLTNLVAGETKGLQVAGIFNKTKGSVQGLQVGGIFNLSTAQVKGLQVGGIANWSSDGTVGSQIAGICNINTGKILGLQVGGISNFSKDAVIGLQAAGIANSGLQKTIGLQVAGIYSQSGGIDGLQVAGINNLSTKKTNGAQIASISNISKTKMNGLQVALFNYAKVNNGLQMGLINLSDTANGVSIGLINLVRRGYHAIELTANEVLYTNLSFKLGSQHFYNIYTIGLSPTNKPVYGLGFGLGSKVKLYKKLFLSVDVTANYILENEVDTSNISLNILSKLDLTLEYHISNHFSIITGPSYNVHVSQLFDETNGTFSSQIAQYPFFEKVSNHTRTQMWIGGRIGLQISF